MPALADGSFDARQEQLDPTQKLEAASALAHDFNNLLSIITTYSLLALEQLEPEAPMRSDLEEVCRAADQAAQLTQKLMALGRKPDGVGAAHH